MASSFVSSLVNSTMGTSSYLGQVRDKVQALADAEKARQEHEQDRERQAGLMEYQAHAKLLEDPEWRIRASDDDVTTTMGRMQAAASRLANVGVEMPVDTTDPIPGYISQIVSKMQTDPTWRSVAPLQRYQYLVGKFGKHWYNMEAQYINESKIAGLTNPQTVTTNQAEIDKANNENQTRSAFNRVLAPATRQSHVQSFPLPEGIAGPERPNKITPASNGLAPVDVPGAQTYTSPAMSAAAATAQDLFGDYYEPVLQPKEMIAQMTNDMSHYVSLAKAKGENDPVVQSLKEQLLNQYSGSGGLTAEKLAAAFFTGNAYTANQQKQFDQLKKDVANHIYSGTQAMITWSNLNPGIEPPGDFDAINVVKMTDAEKQASKDKTASRTQFIKDYAAAMAGNYTKAAWYKQYPQIEFPGLSPDALMDSKKIEQAMDLAVKHYKFDVEEHKLAREKFNESVRYHNAQITKGASSGSGGGKPMTEGQVRNKISANAKEKASLVKRVTAVRSKPANYDPDTGEMKLSPAQEQEIQSARARLDALANENVELRGRLQSGQVQEHASNPKPAGKPKQNTPESILVTFARQYPNLSADQIKRHFAHDPQAGAWDVASVDAILKKIGRL